MDAVLAEALQVAYLVRDSEEGKAWREAWNSLNDLLNPPSIMPSPGEEIPLTELVGALRRSEVAEVRPLLFPLIVGKFSPHLNAAQVRNGLKEHSEALKAYQQLVSCMGLTSLLIAFLRSVGPGYPHEHLAHTLPEVPWRHLSNLQELPWNMGGFLLPMDATDARLIGLKRFVPSLAQQLAASLNLLGATIKTHDVWLQLKESYRQIAGRPNLDKKLRRIRVRFGRGMEKLSHSKPSKSAWHLEAEKLAQRLYSKGGARIRSYMESFLEYERLIERIYWLLSQLLMHECISCITSAVPQQLQQVSLGYGKRRRLTALSETSVKTLEVGQLVHISLIETGHLMDGLYLFSA